MMVTVYISYHQSDGQFVNVLTHNRTCVNEIVCTAFIITTRKRSLGQGNIFTSVCHSVHRGKGVYPTPTWMQTPWVGQTPRDQTPGLSRPPSVMGRPPDTANKQAVRILLECILVSFYLFPTQLHYSGKRHVSLQFHKILFVLYAK